MRDGEQRDSRIDRAGDEPLVDARGAIFAAKLRPPDLRDGLISRAALVERMLARDSEPVVAIVAPPGYGKTTLLAEWVTKQRRDVAWVTIDEGDNDPSVLLFAIAVGLSRVQPLDAGVIEAVAARTVPIPAALSALTSAFAPTKDVVLVLDNLESVTSRESRDLIVELFWQLPPGSRLAYASRSLFPLPTALLRSRGAVVEIGADDLAMDRREARELLAANGARLSGNEIDSVFDQTEGWPTGLYLAALAAQGRRPPLDAFAFGGDDVLMEDYLRSEILAQLPAATVSFLTRTSLLEQLCGPLCDAVLEAEGSQAMLESLESSNLLLVPLDRQRGWYRYHPLLRDLLATELLRREPGVVAGLHGRAARWLAAHSLVEPGIRQAQRSGDPDLVAQLVASASESAYASGRAIDVRAWLEWFRGEKLVDRYPGIAVLGGLVEALSGNPAGTERWVSAAESYQSGMVEDRDLTGSLAYLRSILCRQGAAQMRIDAQLAQAALDPDSGLRPGALICEALSYLLDGELELADPALNRAYDASVYLQDPPTAAAALGFRGAIAWRREDWAGALDFADRALHLVEAGHLHGYFEAGVVYAIASRASIRRGNLTDARDQLARAARIRPLLTYAVPLSALIQLEIARSYLYAADPAGARAVLREVGDILHQRPDLGVVAREAHQLRLASQTTQRIPVGASALTAAELRLLPFLATHLTLAQIGDRLYLSRNTIKSQAISVYRKLEASSRSEAVQQAHQLGLLGH